MPDPMRITIKWTHADEPEENAIYKYHGRGEALTAAEKSQWHPALQAWLEIAESGDIFSITSTSYLVRIDADVA